MALSDLITKARVNMALARDPRVGSLDIGVHVHDSFVTLTGDTEDQAECNAVEEITRRVEGVAGIKNDMTCGVGKNLDMAELVTHHFQARLREVFAALPDKHALTLADYTRWALWLTYKLHLPGHGARAQHDSVEMATMEAALAEISNQVGIPKVLLAMEMLRQAEAIADTRHSAPTLENTPLIATPVAEEA